MTAGYWIRLNTHTLTRARAHTHTHTHTHRELTLFAAVHTMWQHRALYNNTNHTHKHTHTYTPPQQSLEGAVTSLIFAATKVFGRNKSMLVATKPLLQQTRVSRDKYLSRQAYFCHVFCRDKNVFVATKMILLAAPANDTQPSLPSPPHTHNRELTLFAAVQRGCADGVVHALVGGQTDVTGRHEREALGTVLEVARVAATATTVGRGALRVDHTLTLRRAPVIRGDVCRKPGSKGLNVKSESESKDEREK